MRKERSDAIERRKYVRAVKKAERRGKPPPPQPASLYAPPATKAATAGGPERFGAGPGQRPAARRRADPRGAGPLRPSRRLPTRRRRRPPPRPRARRSPALRPRARRSPPEAPSEAPAPEPEAEATADPEADDGAAVAAEPADGKPKSFLGIKFGGGKGATAADDESSFDAGEPANLLEPPAIPPPTAPQPPIAGATPGAPASRCRPMTTSKPPNSGCAKKSPRCASRSSGSGPRPTVAWRRRSASRGSPVPRR